MSTYYKKRPVNNSLKNRIAENYDVVLLTVGAIVLLGWLGFPLSKQTTIIENTNPQKYL